MSDVLSRLTTALADRYRIEREIGSGGMATVYLAQDVKHDRRVAIKVLLPELSAVLGAERFLAEIKTTAALQHPHILPLFDSGSADGLLFYVMPLVEGETLHARLAREKQLPIADAVRLAKEVASALDYAHRHGVIHRDIKPENILLHEGQALVADFGIALAVQSAGGQRMTQTGLSLGTPQYMSPEQAMGERNITARSDVYALGAVTYEMLVGEPPFSGPTTQAVFAKVLTEEPRSLVAQRKSVPEAVEAAVLTALQKLPADRFGSPAEFAAAMDGVQTSVRATGGAARQRHSSSTRSLAATLGWSLAVLAIGYIVGRAGPRGAQSDAVQFTQKTFDEQAIFNARFAPDGKTMVYSAVRRNAAPELFVIRPDYAEPQSLGLRATQLLSISSQGELAVLVRARFVAQRLFLGTLAQVPLGGGAPRELLENIREADWSPDGSQLAVIHEVGGKDRLEFPIGKVLVESPGYLSDPRVSPDGKHVAFAEHAARWDDRGTIGVVDLARTKTVLTPTEFVGVEGLAWSRAGDEVFFSAWTASFRLAVHSVTLGGKLRVVLGGPGHLTMQDISSDGRWLITRDDQPAQVRVRAPGATEERIQGWLDYSFFPVLSRNGELLAFSNQTADGGPHYSVMLRKVDGGLAARLGEGYPSAFSPDDKWVLAYVPTTPPRVMLYATGSGTERRIDIGNLEHITSAEWFRTSQSILLCGNEKGRAARCFVQSPDGGPLRPATPEGWTEGRVSPDERTVLATLSAEEFRLYSLSGDSVRTIRGIAPGEVVVRWSPDGRALWVRQVNSLKVDRLDIATGRRELIMDAPPQTTGGSMWFQPMWMTDDPHVYAYSAREYVSYLFTVAGAR